MAVIRGICSVSESDGLMLVSVADAFAASPWSTVDAVVTEVTGQMTTSAARSMVVDLSLVQDASSAVVASVLKIRRAVIAGHGRLVLVVPSSEAQELFQLSGLDQHLSIVDDTASALSQAGGRLIRLSNRETTLLRIASPLVAAAAVIALLAPEAVANHLIQNSQILLMW